MAKVKNQVAIATIVEVNPINLTEFSTFRSSQLELVKSNPLVIVTDTKSYDAAKKSRTALKTGRTALQSQDKEIAKKLAAFRKACAGAKDELIEITLVAEQKQQTEIDAWEEKKAKLKAEEEAKEQLRIDDLLRKSADVVLEAGKIVKAMTFEDIEASTLIFDQFCNDIDMELFNEPAINFSLTFSEMELLFDNEVKRLKTAEAERVRLAELKAKEEANKIAEKKLADDRKALEKVKADAKKLDQENKRKAALLDCKLLRSDQRELLSEQGYVEDPKDVWKLGGNMISTAILNAELMPVMGFTTLEEVAKCIEIAAKEVRDREAAAKKVAESEIAKNKLAQEKIDKAAIEVGLDMAKKPDLKEAVKTEDIEVIEPYTYPQDLAVNDGIVELEYRINNIRGKIDMILSIDSDIKNKDIKNIQANLHQDLFVVLKTYHDQILALQEIKSIAE